MVRIPRYRGVKAERTITKEVVTKIELTVEDVRRLLRLPPEAKVEVNIDNLGGFAGVTITIVEAK